MFSARDQRLRRVGSPIAVLLALAATLALAAPSSATAAAKTWDGSLLTVATPRDDQLIRGNSVRVKLRLGSGATLRKADLNGKDVRRQFRAGGRVVVATLSKRRVGRALRKGRNFLHVVVRRGTRRTDAETISFTRVVENGSLLSHFRAGHQARKGLRTTVVPSRLTAKVRATLNGRNVSRLYREGMPLRRAVRLGASDGLRHGNNRLRVLVYDFHGDYVARNRTIRVGRQTTIAGAGADRRVKAGGAVRLDGRGSRRALRRDGSARGGKLRFRWRIVRKPRGSKAHLGRRTRVRPVLRTDLPGTYRLQLQTSQPGGGTRRTTSIDLVEVTAEPQPMVPVSTFAEVGGVGGIEVGVTRECAGAKAAAKPPCFYPNPGKATDLQVVVLDRESLEPVSNTAYEGDEVGQFAAAMAKLVTKLEPAKGQKCEYAYDTSKLVLIAHREGALTDTSNLAKGLASFQTSPVDCSPGYEGSVPSDAPFSYVAVPGTLTGKVARNEGKTVGNREAATGKAGSLDGFLKAAADNPAEVAALRSYEAGTEIAFDTRANDGTAVRIGDRYLATAELPPGLAVFHFDPANPASSNFALTATITNTGGDSSAGLEWSKLAQELKFSKIGTGVMIVSTGKLGGFASEPQAESFLTVLEQLEQLGVNPDSFARAVNQENGTYSMISTADYGGRSIGFASSSSIAEGVPDYPGVPASDLPVNDGRLTGMLHRGADQTTFPVEADPSGQSQQPELRSLLFSDQAEWELTPAPETGSASCQETAFAYIVEEVAGVFPEGAAPTLWKDARQRACQGISHTGTAGSRRADSLEGDACASDEVAAIGAIGRNVRAASMALRDAYTSLTYELSQAEVESVTLPKGAPFTAADLTCAKNQMVDELSARRQTERFFEVLRDPQLNLQGETVVDLSQIAEEVKTAALAPLAAKLKPQPESTASFWASFGLGVLSGVAKLTTVVAPEAAPAWRAAARGIELTSSVAQAAITGTLGGSGNPAAAADEYLLLASQIEREQIDVEAQIEEVLTAQQNGANRGLAVILSDPRRLATVNERAKGAWSIDAEALELAQKAYGYRVAQLAYGALIPQVYVGALYDHYTMKASTSPATQASQAECYYGGIPYPSADPGTPKGLGQGNEYQAQAGAAVKGQSPFFLDFVAVEPFEAVGNPPPMAPPELLRPVFSQPVRPNGTVVPNAAGLYAPDFWFQDLGLTRVTRCTKSELILFKNPHGGPFQAVIPGAELWPFG